jgi:DNA-directed RNA polymerase subunit RPC12/RpoP
VGAAAVRRPGGVCPRCGGRRLTLRGPVTIHIRGR